MAKMQEQMQEMWEELSLMPPSCRVAAAQDLAALNAAPREGVLQLGVEQTIPGIVPAANALTRRGGLLNPVRKQPRRIVVDVREFMSSLPAVLHQQHMDIAPITLEVRTSFPHAAPARPLLCAPSARTSVFYDLS
jgi:hypothetical protein